MSLLFADNLRELDFDVSDRSLLLVSQLNDDNLDPTEIFALETAKIFRADAVYFRHFPYSRPPVPQIYLYDNTEDKLSADDLANVHRDLWSNCRIPMFIVIEKTAVAIFDTRKPVTVSNGKIETTPFDKISLAADAIKNYSKKLFDSGIFWETEQAKGHFLESTSAYRDLIDGLKHIRDEFLKKAELPKSTAHKLLVFAVLIKYLEERGNESGSLFAQNFFQNFNAHNFCDVLRQKGKIVVLFDKLSQHFNGKIFEWSNNEERAIVEQADLSRLADFLDADIELQTGQYFFWRRYAFNHLPIELISTVYEAFLSERKDAVYTPEFLVNTLLDDVLPQSDYKRTSFKTIDVSCGSGVFLVGVFKRLVRRYRYSKFKQTGQLVKPNDKTLLSIIKNNIFGVDIEPDAIRLTVFSLCLALCDELTPKQIWTELKFDDTFQTNFQAENFFDFLNHTDPEKWDLVIGNPPFKELSLSEDEQGNYFYYDKDLKRIVKLNAEVSQRAKKNIYPQNQLALMFLDQVPRLLKGNALLCLILPAAPLLYNNSSEFREHFFSGNQILQILDFTNLDSILFTANVPTTALFARKQNCPDEEPVTHVTIRRTRSVEERLFFEVDKYDIHQVSPRKAMYDKHIWKCNLLGGGRLNNLIGRLSNVSSIGELITSKGWASGEGYIIGTAKRKRKPANYITDRRTLPTRAFTETGVDEAQITTEMAKEFYRISDEELFTPPHLLIKENVGVNKIPTYFSDEYLTFKHSIFGIAAPESERKSLYNLYRAFDQNKKIYKFFIAATSNVYLISRAGTLLKQDILALPYPENKEELRLSYVEQILCDDVLNYYIELLSKGGAAKANQSAGTDTLKDFGEVFTKALNSIYEEDSKRFHLKGIYDWEEYYIVEFNYGANAEEVTIQTAIEPTENIKSLIESKTGSNLYLIKIVKIYERNKIYLIKPKPIRFWLRSVGFRDADEVFTDLIQAGY